MMDAPDSSSDLSSSSSFGVHTLLLLTGTLTHSFQLLHKRVALPIRELRAAITSQLNHHRRPLAIYSAKSVATQAMSPSHPIVAVAIAAR